MSGICGPNPDPKWNCIQNTPGARVLATLYNLDDHGQLSDSSANGIVANVVSYGFTVATLQCKQSFIESQEISVNCDNAILGAAVGTNPNCIECKKNMQAIVDLRNKLDQDANQINPNYQIPIPSPVLVDQFNGKNPNHNDGVCRYVCLQCVIEDIEQTLQMNINASCQTNTNSFISSFTSGMSYQAEYQLTQHQNAMKNAGYDIKSQSDVKSLAIQMSDAITQMTTNSSLSDLQQLALNVQSTIIEPESTSIILNHIVQNISIQMMSSICSSLYNDTRMQDAINYKLQLQTIQIEENFEDLIKTLEASTKTLEGLVLSLIGSVLIAIIALLLAAIIIFVFYIRFVLNRAQNTMSAITSSS